MDSKDWYKRAKSFNGTTTQLQKKVFTVIFVTFIVRTIKELTNIIKNLVFLIKVI